MQGIITEVVDKFGYLGILILIFVENIFPPIPSEVILTFGGFLTTCSKITILGTTIFATLGSVAGAIVLYLLGKILSKERLDKIIDGKVGRHLHLNKADIDKSRNSFLKKGNNTVFFCRFVPIVRSMISIPAGMAEMNFFRFLFLTTLGSFAWNLLLISIGAFAGRSWERAAEYADRYSDIVKVVLMAIACICIIRIISEKRVQKKAGKGT